MLQYSVNSTPWMKLYCCYGHAKQDSGHPMLWSHTIPALLCPMLFTGSTYASLSLQHAFHELKCHVWQICFSPVWNHLHADIVPFHIDNAYMHLAFMFPLQLEVFHLLSKTTLILMVTREMSLLGECMSFLWKHNQLLVVHWSTHLLSLDLFRPFFLGVVLFKNNRVITSIYLITKIKGWRYMQMKNLYLSSEK